MDGIEDAGNVVVIATTNRPELLDRALLRPGRLEVKVSVPPPDALGRRDIFDIHARGLANADALAADAVATLHDPAFFADGGATVGFSGAEIEGFTRALASYALERAAAGGPRVVTGADVADALEDLQRDREANARAAAVRDAAWPALAALEASWLDAARGAPKDEAEVRAFLERKAFVERDIELPLKQSDVDDLARNLFRYLLGGVRRGGCFELPRVAATPRLGRGCSVAASRAATAVNIPLR